MPRWRRRAATITTALAVVAASCSGGGDGGKVAADEVVIGVPDESTTTATRGPRVIVAPEPPPADLFVDGEGRTGGLAEPGPGRHLAVPDGAPWPAPVTFTSATKVPPDLIFVLVIGSDARPKEDLLKTRADSVHLLAVNPSTGQGTILGLPRDSWVEIPGKGRGKINSALALGGPDLLAATVRRTTGLPVDYYLLTGFTGLTRMVDELGGVDVMVDRRMNDHASGALFERGWHHFTGGEALAFSRNRKDVANGDFSRSANHGTLILSALAKMRGEVADDGGLSRWIEVLVRHARIDVPVSALPGLAALARGLDPARITNVVAPGRVGTSGGQSVVFLTKGAIGLFDDLRADGVVGGASAPLAPGPAPAPAAATPTSGGGPAPAPPTPASSTTSPAPEERQGSTTTTAPPAVRSPLPIPGRPPSSSTTAPGEEEGGGEEPPTAPTEPETATTTTTGGEAGSDHPPESSADTTSTTAPAEGSGGGSGGSRRGRRG